MDIINNTLYFCSWASDVHTTVCTISIRCSLSLLMIPAMSTTPLSSACSRAMSMVMKVPVRPTPALQCTMMGGPSLFHSALTFLCTIMRGLPYCGTPWSGHEVKWYWVTVTLDWWPLTYERMNAHAGMKPQFQIEILWHFADCIYKLTQTSSVRTV